MVISISQCLRCDHLIFVFDDKAKCKAYADVPNKIYRNNHDHRKPYKGDKGIRFEPIKKGKR